MAATETSTRAAAQLDDLYRRHVGDVYRYTYAVLGNHADAEDVTQTTFVNALRALERGEDPRNASTWLVAISQNIVRQRWPRGLAADRGRAAVRTSRTSPPRRTSSSTSSCAFQRIPPTQREALVLRELEGRSYNEISELRSLDLGARRCSSARRSLAEELQNIVTCHERGARDLEAARRTSVAKGSRRLDEHLAECELAPFAETQRWQRRGFKGLAGCRSRSGSPSSKGRRPPRPRRYRPSVSARRRANGAGAGGVAAALVPAQPVGRPRSVARWRCHQARRRIILASAVAKVAAVVIQEPWQRAVGYEGRPDLGRAFIVVRSIGEPPPRRRPQPADTLVVGFGFGFARDLPATTPSVATNAAWGEPSRSPAVGRSGLVVLTAGSRWQGDPARSRRRRWSCRAARARRPGTSRRAARAVVRARTRDVGPGTPPETTP